MNDEKKGQGIELVKFNYEKLHESLWESHKIAWTITSIFIPVIFGLQGYLGKEYLLSHKNPKEVLIAIVAGVLILESLLLFWRLMIWMLEAYNEVRVKGLRKIEEVFVKELERQQEGGAKYSPELVKNYGSLSYKREIPSLNVSISWKWIYNAVVVVITVMNTCFVTYRIHRFLVRDGERNAVMFAVAPLLVLILVTVVWVGVRILGKSTEEE